MTGIKVGEDAREILKKAGVDEAIGKKNVVLYFYPKDFTLGCTREAQDFRDAKAEFDAANTEIVACRPTAARATRSSLRSIILRSSW